MKNYCFLFASLAVLILLPACETLNSSQSNQFASSNQDIIELRNDVAVLKRAVANLQAGNEQILKNQSALQSQINYVNDRNQQQSKALSDLRQALRQECARRQAAMTRVIETVADQTAKTVNSVAARRPEPAAAASSPAGAPGVYYKHKVGAGETLSAIARAYKVSVEDIRSANRIKGDIIRVGQILHIPKK
ncbi:MAG: LysM peptidoglycan-binding domain-containing protein [Victivallaceae bacterium]|nr:LysM peptidoglycan-binding domain-containing protein [Victivallaceae bacterium]